MPKREAPSSADLPAKRQQVSKPAKSAGQQSATEHQVKHLYSVVVRRSESKSSHDLSEPHEYEKVAGIFHDLEMANDAAQQVKEALRNRYKDFQTITSFDSGLSHHDMVGPSSGKATVDVKKFPLDVLVGEYANGDANRQPDENTGLHDRHTTLDEARRLKLPSSTLQRIKGDNKEQESEGEDDENDEDGSEGDVRDSEGEIDWDEEMDPDSEFDEEVGVTIEWGSRRPDRHSGFEFW